MPWVLKNSNLEVLIDRPGERYQAARFDQTGKITKITYKGICLTTNELPSGHNPARHGCGLYNEFDIDHPPGFSETQIGEWFHKIGVGLVQKDAHTYQFDRSYQVSPAQFECHADESEVKLACEGPLVNGYGYYLKKQIILTPNGLDIRYQLKNTGSKPLQTSEYVHNFLCFGVSEMGVEYQLRFSRLVNAEAFREVVNPNGKVRFSGREVRLSAVPGDPFFFSHLFGKNSVSAYWKLINRKYGLALSELGSFKTTKINLWGWGHVISPELFIQHSILPGDTHTWSRNYRIEELK